jgi:FdhD protein
MIPRVKRGVEGRAVIKAARAETDLVAVEEPLEIRLAGETLAVTMRTPGEDRALAVGFLFAEGVITSIDELGSVAHCGRPTDEGYGNVIDALPAPGITLDAAKLDGARRGTLTTASCGVCGRRSIDDLIARVGVGGGDPIDRARILEAPAKLAAGQTRFVQTGGVHAAAAIDRDGDVLAIAEDVGRHNAVDKVVGTLLYEHRRAAILAVSGRVSFEIVQKAAALRFEAIAAVSAPTSLAIDLAARAGIVLCAFVRDGRCNVYTHAERLIG